MPQLSKRTPPINNIHETLLGLIVDVQELVPDPDNARLHPERNLREIQESLSIFGQRKPIVVRKQNMTVVAGNGLLEAAKRLGWTKIAATIQEMTDAEAAGYGLADNRVAESSQWDAEVVARLQKLHESTGGCRTGWSDEDLLTLRAAEWEQPSQDGDGEQTWQELWQGMPEFDQQDLTAAVQFKVNCATEDDAKAFLERIGQLPGDVTQGNSVWFPKAEINTYADKRYAVDDE